MSKSISSKNIVFVGHFQPSKFDKYFFIKNGLFNEEEILETSVFNIDIVQLNTLNVALVILLNQIILNQVSINEDSISEISGKLFKYLDESVTALGINFTWNVNTDKSLEEFSKELFLNDKNTMFENFFNTQDAIFGSYVSKEIKNGRLKLDMKPQAIRTSNKLDTVARFLSFVFNFHFEIQNKENYYIFSEAINDYSELFKTSKEIMSGYE